MNIVPNCELFLIHSFNHYIYKSPNRDHKKTCICGKYNPYWNFSDRLHLCKDCYNMYIKKAEYTRSTVYTNIFRNIIKYIDIDICHKMYKNYIQLILNNFCTYMCSHVALIIKHDYYGNMLLNTLNKTLNNI
jgi:hypothetical protein